MVAIDLGLVVDCAALAPSVHNTQPWRFVAGDDVLEVHADDSRRLAFLDPDSRLLHISCGAAIEFARLAIRSSGHECEATLLPDPAAPELLARLRIGADVEPTALDDVMVGAMARRYTDRGPYDGRPVDAAVLAELRHGAEAFGVWLAVLSERSDRVALASILADAEQAEAMNPEYTGELAQWVHAGPDGVPLPAVAEWPHDVVTDVPLRTFAPGAAPLHPSEAEPPVVVRDTIVVLGTDGDTPRDWLSVGAAVAWVQLRATVEDLSTQPLGPATDFPSTRMRLRHELRLHGEPQFVLRMGYGAGRPWTGRRSSEQVLSRADHA